MYEERIEVLKAFQPLIIDNPEEIKIKRNFLLISGRIGGKTICLAQKIYKNIMDYPDHDIVILRANSSSMSESIFMVVKKYFFDHTPDNIFAQFKWKSSPPLRVTTPFGNEIKFSGVGLGAKSGSNISRGKTTEKKLSLIVVEETQEIFSGETGTVDLLNHALATFMRDLDDQIGKVIFAGNRERNKNAKFNVWAESKRDDPSFTIIETSWLDLRANGWLNRATIQLIEIEKEMNPRNYEYMYLGIPVGGSDLVYGAFTQSEHVLMPKEDMVDVYIDNRTKEEYDFSKENVLRNVEKVYIGVDGSTTKDMCIFMPIFQFKNGALVCKLGDMLQHNPDKNGQIRNNVMANRYVREWLFQLINKYGIQYKEKIFILDGHNTDLAENLEYEFGGYCRIVRFTKKDLVATSDRVNNSFTARKLFLTHEEWTEIISKDKIHPYVLYNELETVCWREDDGTKFNDSIPNDRTDGIRYPVAYHANPYQIKDLRKKKGDE